MVEVDKRRLRSYSPDNDDSLHLGRRRQERRGDERASVAHHVALGERRGGRVQLSCCGERLGDQNRLLDGFLLRTELRVPRDGGAAERAQELGLRVLATAGPGVLLLEVRAVAVARRCPPLLTVALLFDRWLEYSASASVMAGMATLIRTGARIFLTPGFSQNVRSEPH